MGKADFRKQFTNCVHLIPFFYKFAARISSAAPPTSSSSTAVASPMPQSMLDNALYTIDTEEETIGTEKSQARVVEAGSLL